MKAATQKIQVQKHDMCMMEPRAGPDAGRWREARVTVGASVFKCRSGQVLVKNPQRRARANLKRMKSNIRTLLPAITCGAATGRALHVEGVNAVASAPR